MVFGLTLGAHRPVRVFVISPRENRSIFRCALALLCLCALVPDIAEAQQPAAMAQERPAIVPDLFKQPIETALRMIDRAGLARGSIVDRPYSGPPGIVLDQSLKPGTQVRRGTLLHLGVSQERPAIVPDVVNRPIETALLMIDKAGLARGNVVDRPADGPPGRVLDQSLKAGTEVRRGTLLHLGVSQERPAIVPDVVNRPIETALLLIDKAGLARGNVVDRPADGPPGRVLDQSLRPGIEVRRGTLLHLGVSQERPAIVPDVVNRPLETALLMIDKAGLARGNVVDRPADGPPGRVLDQSLKAGTEVRRGTLLHLGVSQERPAIVPDVVNRPIETALLMIDKAGLARGNVVDRAADGPPGRVLDQSLRAGIEVRRGTLLHLGVSQERPAIVPDVVNRPIETALLMIDKAGLARGNVVDRAADGPPGRVLDQSLRAGTEVRRGTLLHLGVSQERPAIVPDVVNRPIETALLMIDKAGLARGNVVDRTADGPPGRVLDQSLRAGIEVRRGTLLHLGVSQERPAIVPDVVNRPLETALLMIDKAGLARGNVVDRPADGPLGRVLDQSLKAGTEVRRGTLLHLGVSQERPAIVPDVVNRPLETALLMIDKAGLARGNVVDRPADGPLGRVLDQSLKAGTEVRRGTLLHLGVSQERPAIVPDVVNRPLETALLMIDKAGLARGNVVDRTADGPPGRVLDQSLRAGIEVRRGTPLHLTISQVELPTVPDLINRPLETALLMVDKAGLARGTITNRPSSGQAGMVLDQSPKPGERVARRTPVHLTVSQTPIPSPLVSVPDITTLSTAEAFARIDKAELARGNVTNRPSPGPAGIVLDQSPKPGERVARRTPVHLTVSQTPIPSPLVSVPDVTTLSTAEAFARGDNARLARGNVTNRTSPGPAGVVLDQSPKAGERVPPATPLHLTVSQAVPSPLVSVPDVIKLSTTEAFARIDKVGLARGNVTNRTSVLRPGTVLEQSLKPGDQVPRGTPLHLTVSQIRLVEGELVTVPEVINLSTADAFARIDEAGLARGNVTNRPSQGPPDVVVDQSLRPGEQVTRGTPINLDISQPEIALDPPSPPEPDPPTPPTVIGLVVPDVVGRSLEEARALVGQAGLSVGAITPHSFFLPPFFQRAGTVFQQQPAARTTPATPIPVNLVVLSPLPVWALVLPSVLLGAALGLMIRRRPPRLRADPPPQHPASLPTVIAHAYADLGEQKIPSVTNPVSFEIRLRHTIDPGVQSVREVSP